MKFDYIIGNPPYNEEAPGSKISDDPLYHYFMDAAYNLSDKVELITQAKFLSNAGNTPENWNKKMLSDPHLKVIKKFDNASDVFPNSNFKGGVVITYRNANEDYGAIVEYTQYSELNSILKRVLKKDGFESLNKNFIYAPGSYKFTTKVHEENPWVKERLSKGHLNDITSDIFNKLPELFYNEKPSDDYICLLGLYKEGKQKTGKRMYKWIKKSYVNEHDNLNFYKVIVPAANGSGKFGEVLSSPLIGQPLVGHTQTFLSIGKFETEQEAEACLKYIKTKFARAMIGVKKTTHNGKGKVYEYVPLQDFTSSSDIDWSESVDGIDKQLYKKYGLDDKEIEFIESHVEAME